MYKLNTCSVAEVTQTFLFIVQAVFVSYPSYSLKQWCLIGHWIRFSHMAILQAVKDWLLTTAMVVISAVIFLMSILSAAVTPLRPDLRLRPDVERPSGVNYMHAQLKAVLLRPHEENVSYSVSKTS